VGYPPGFGFVGGPAKRSTARGRRSSGVGGAAPEEDGLVSEAIERIRGAEREAEEALKRARADGKRLVAEAHEEAERMLDAMRKEARAEETALIEKARADAEAEAAEIVQASKISVDEARQGAADKVRVGVVKVLDSITATATRPRE